MTHLRSTTLLLALGCGLIACASQGGTGGKASSAGNGSPMVMVVGGAPIEIQQAALSFPKPSGRFEGWLGYALMRRIWIDSKFRERFPGESKYTYTFEEELDARESAAKIWGELNAKEHLTDRYFGDLQKVSRAGFFREYVWYCVPHQHWKEATGLRRDSFARWLPEGLPSHRVETWVSTFPTESGGRVVLGAQPHRATTCQVPVEDGHPSNEPLNPPGANASTS